MKSLDWTCAGWALFKAICNGRGDMIDAQFLNVNHAWRHLTGIRDSPAGKTLKEIFPHTEAYWLEVFSLVIKTGIAKRFSNYHCETDKWWDTLVFKAKEGEFAVLFKELDIDLKGDPEDEERNAIYCEICALTQKEKRLRFLRAMRNGLIEMQPPQQP